MTTQETATMNAPSSSPKMNPEAYRGQSVELAFYLKKKGYTEATIKSQCGAIRTLYNLGANLNDPENVKGVIALHDCQAGSKRNLVNAYANFARMMKVSLPEMPTYKKERKMAFIPNESELDLLIGCAGDKLQPFLQTLKETSARSGEIARLKWSDVDFEKRIITINDPEKNSNPRQIEISDKLIAMLKRVPHIGDLVWGENANNRMRKNFHSARQRLAYRTQNPRIKQIHLHTFRHWGATMMYFDVKDPLAVMNHLGHKSITSTQYYMQYIKASGKPEWICKVARTVEEIQSLIEGGFEYVCDLRVGEIVYKMFRKRKQWKPS